MVSRYLRLLWITLRASLLLSLQYRVEFVVDGLSAALMNGVAVLPLVVAQRQAGLAGWSLPESLLVLGFFMLLRGVIDGGVNPSMVAAVEQVRKGTLDFVLMKPADAQFLVSTGRFEVAALTNAVAGAVLLGWGLRDLPTPTPFSVLLCLLLLLNAVLLIYALWLLAVSSAVRFVRVEMMIWLFSTIFDASRWPSSVFRGGWALFFTFVLPLGVMTTWPAAALLQRLDTTSVLMGLAVSLLFTLGSRAIWRRSLSRYTSASS